MTAAVSRLAERYNIHLTKEEMGALIKRLRDGEGTIIDKQDGGSERRLITVRQVPIIVVWSSTLSRLISVLPRRRKLPKLRRRERGKDGRTKREGKRPEAQAEWE